MTDIYQALENDHEELKTMLSELVSLEEGDDYREVLIQNISTLLMSHARAEESVFYNSIRAVSDSSTVMHGYKEHMEAEGVLRKLQLKEVTGTDWTTAAKDLEEALLHHIQEEETDIFDHARQIFSEEEARQMGEAFLELQEKIRDQGAFKNSFDMVVNLMPPRFVEKIRNLGSDRGVY
ncbi:MAG TPA: hemerythrin domain-containing protein [Bacteriovoracaceae bacterium]|nr:hemerythrin domain-containing protein [Bacteriovoracaceae bacterium]